MRPGHGPGLTQTLPDNLQGHQRLPLDWVLEVKAPRGQSWPVPQGSSIQLFLLHLGKLRIREEVTCPKILRGSEADPSFELRCPDFQPAGAQEPTFASFMVIDPSGCTAPSPPSQADVQEGDSSPQQGPYLYLPAFGLVISQLGDKVLTVLFQKAVLHLCINHLICRLEDLVHRPRSVLVVQDVVDAILAAPHHVLQALPLHHCLAGQDGEEAGGPSPWVFIWRGRQHPEHPAGRVR